MKVLLIFSLSILVIGCILGWLEHRRLPALQEEHQKLTQAAANLGITVDQGEIAHHQKSLKVRPRASADREDTVSFLSGLDEFIRRGEEHQRNGTQLKEELTNRQIEFIQRLQNLDPDFAKLLLSALKQDEQINHEEKQKRTAVILTILSEKYPEGAVSLYLKNRDLLREGDAKGMISMILYRLDPESALAWIQKAAKTMPELISSENKLSVVAGIGHLDPTRAFELAEGLLPKESKQASLRIVRAAANGPARLKVLAAIRAKAMQAGPQGPQVIQQLFPVLGSRMASQGFDKTEAWLKSTTLTEEETQAFAKGIAEGSVKNDRGHWSKWLENNLSPTPNGQQAIKQFIDIWTNEDYQAAGAWINKTKDGPIKQAAVEVYAAKLAQYEPDIAEEWASTLPEGKAKERLFETIQAHRAKKTPEDLESE